MMKQYTIYKTTFLYIKYISIYLLTSNICLNHDKCDMILSLIYILNLHLIVILFN